MVSLAHVLLRDVKPHIPYLAQTTMTLFPPPLFIYKHCRTCESRQSSAIFSSFPPFTFHLLPLTFQRTVPILSWLCPRAKSIYLFQKFLFVCAVRTSSVISRRIILRAWDIDKSASHTVTHFLKHSTMALHFAISLEMIWQTICTVCHKHCPFVRRTLYKCACTHHFHVMPTSIAT